MKKSAIALTVSGILFVAGSVQAQPTGYIGASIGQSDVDVSGYDQATSYRIFGGMNFSQYFGVEVAYTNLGEFDVKGASNTFIEVDGFEVAGVGTYPVANNIAIYGKAGFYSWNLDATLFGTNIGSDDGTDLTYGIGAKFQIANPINLHVEYQRYNSISDADIDTFYGGLTYTF